MRGPGRIVARAETDSSLADARAFDPGARCARLPGFPMARETPRPTHFVRSRAGLEARMVDVGAKPATARTALARAVIAFPPRVLAALLAGRGPKGPVREVARAAGVLAAKRTDALIPLCHTLPLDAVDVAFRRLSARRLEVRCRASCRAPTGVEMEALVGVAVAALTVYDMGKALGHGIRIEALELLEKRGGRSGAWRRGR